jgi:hypothetical protein
MKKVRHLPDPRLLENFIQESGVSYFIRGNSYVFSCPKCNKPEKLWIFRDGSSFVCFVCDEDGGFHGAPEYALSEITGKSVADVRSAIYKIGHVASDAFVFKLDEDSEPDEPEEEEDVPDLIWPSDHVTLDSDAGRPGRIYLGGRGIPASIAIEYDIRYAVADRAIAFPVTIGNKLVGWQHRYLEERTFVNKAGKEVKQKVKSTAGMPRSRSVMFSHRLEGSEACVLCEGPVDALKAHYVGGNIATMGKNVNEGQIELIKSSGVNKIYFALDPDAAGALTQLAKKFEGMEMFKVNIPDGYKDLGEMPLDLATETILNSEPLDLGNIYLYFKS